MNTCNIFWTYKEIIIGCLVKTKKQFFKGVVHEQPCSSIVCLLWRSSIVSNFCLEHVIFHNPALLSFSFPLLKRFSFYFLSSILLEISICLNLHFPKISDFLCAHTHMRQEHGVPPGGVQDGLLAMMLQLNYLQSFLGKCSSWGYCLWHGVTTWNMGLLFVKSSKNTVLKWSQSILIIFWEHKKHCV